MKLKSKTCTLRYILVLIFLYSNCLFANNISFYSTSDGLLSNNVVDIVQDTTGFVWFASDNGVSRFDGYNFKNYITDKDFSNKNIGIITDAYGVVVVISEKGIKRYCQFSNRFFDFDFNKKLSYFVKGNKNFIAGFEDGTLKYFEVNDDIVEIELEDQTINYNNIVLFDNGYIFQDSVNNIIKYNVKDKSKTIIYKSEISDLYIIAGNKANELLLLENKKLFKIDVDENNIKTPFFENNTIENICYSNNSYIINLKNDSKLKVIKNSSIISEVDIAELDISNVKKCYIDKHDNIWISHLLGGFSLITSKPNKFSFWNINASFLEKVTSIAICNNNKIYASTNLGSILKFDSSGKKVVFWQNTLKSAISKIQFDRDGNLWILSIDNNMIILDKNGNPIPRFYNQYIKSISQILDIKSFVLDSNSVWVANNEGAIFNINLLNNEKNEITFNNNDKDEALVNHLYYNEKNKQLYISTNHGIYVVDRNFKLKKIFSEIKYINCINIDSEGAIWIGSKLGLFKSKDESSNPILFKQSQDISINSIVITSKDDVWISTTNFLMYCPRNISALLRYDSLTVFYLYLFLKIHLQ
jgi:ligand-binding sensor domain-containing protein